MTKRGTFTFKSLPIGADASDKTDDGMKSKQRERNGNCLIAFNAVCVVPHLALGILCATACYLNSTCEPENMEVPIFRIAGNWTGPNADGYALGLTPNGSPIRFDLAAAWFHFLSAIFHTFPVLLFIDEKCCNSRRLETMYYAYMDDALCYWRCVAGSALRNVGTTHASQLARCARRQVDRVLRFGAAYGSAPRFEHRVELRPR